MNNGNTTPATGYASDRAAKSLLVLSLSYLVFGLTLGVVGGFQYFLPDFLKEALAFQKTRPLHVYLVITWIFTAAQAGLYYYLPRVSNRPMYWLRGVWLHVFMQLAVSLSIITCFFLGYFGGREYLEFPPLLGLFIFLSWIPFAINFFGTLKPNYRTAPVYIWSWTTGIIFFFITLSESYLWIFDFFKNNIVRDVTIQWKALGSMVGSWNMLVYGTSMYVMERMSRDTKAAHSKTAFFFYFLGLTNLMFNWGHHTYIVPAAPWVKTVAYTISMTELLILARLIYLWKQTMTQAMRTYYRIPFRLLSYADIWIFLNLALSIALSVPSWNFYTHGTHFTVAHAMGATIGINTMLLLTSVYYMLECERPDLFLKHRNKISTGIVLSNVSLAVFWLSLIGLGLVKIGSRLHKDAFFTLMEKCQPWFQVFAYSGTLVLVGLALLAVPAMGILKKSNPAA